MSSHQREQGDISDVEDPTVAANMAVQVGGSSDREERNDDSDDEGFKSAHQTDNEDIETVNRTLVSDLQAHLNDEDISDVALRGTDGRTVPAVRSILAMRSRFFKSLLFGSFQESNQREVPLGYSSLVLRAVVEYCYTDEIKITFENLTFEETARSMVGLVAAGNYFELGGLMSRAYRLTCLMMDEYPALACSVLDEAVCGENKGIHTDELSRVALGIIRLRTESALLPPDSYGSGVKSLGEGAMELVMSDEKIQANELQLFHCLQKWSQHVPEGQNEQTVADHRRVVAQQMASRIDFAKVAPSDLANIVACSDFVPLELMCIAYRTQALQAERKGMVFGQMRTVAHATNGRVMVQGAGLPAVNGTYLSRSSAPSYFAQFQQYSRKGVLLEYGVGEFVLHTLTMRDDTKKWLLSFRNQDETMLDLYTAPILSDEIIPPMQQWVACANTHEKLRRIASRSKISQKKKSSSHHAKFVSGESENGGDPPPICIWLPDDPVGRSALANQ
mmetsp:Transcript_11360/g.18800  ORF Transcript_11360/g.18800 Transcript_11360/m.18800 type:complete len:505 (+) Transcript_11360:46-1560(+)